MRLRQRPYNLFLLTALGLFLAGLFSFNSLVNIFFQRKYHLFYFTYYVWIFAALLFVFWLLYLLTKHFLFSKVLSWTHIFLTLISCLTFFVFSLLFKRLSSGLAGMPRYYYDTNKTVYEVYLFWTRTAVIIGLLFIIGQLTYLTNLFIGLTKRFKQNSR